MLVLFVFVFPPLFERWSKMPGSPGLQHGQRVLFQMMGRDTLRSIGFFDDHPKALPSDFVRMVDDPNHILWPPEPKKNSDHIPDSGTKSKRLLLPTGVVFSSHERTTQDSDEIVLVPDDANRQIILRGYSPGESEITYEYTWDFPTRAGEIHVTK